MNTKNIKLNFDKRAKYITAHIQNDPFVQFFAMFYLLLIVLVFGLVFSWIFQLMVHSHFEVAPLRYALFWLIVAFCSFIIASAGYDKEIL